MAKISGRHPPGASRGGLAFFIGFLRNPGVVASFIPSSRFLERRIVEAAAISTAKLVVELGPGTGGTTRALLRALPADSKLLVIELDPGFAAMLRKEAQAESRLIVHEGSAEDLPGILSHHGLAMPDAVLSGIPFSTIPEPVGRGIIDAIWDSLTPEGRFVAYQVRGRVAELARDRCGAPAREIELLNAPPLRIYRWCKPAGERATSDEFRSADNGTGA